VSSSSDLRAPVADTRPAPRRRGGARWLRTTLVALDALAISTAWVLALLLGPSGGGRGQADIFALAAIMAATVTVGILSLLAQRLYRARVCSLRTVETRGLARAAVVSAVVGYLIGDRIDSVMSPGLTSMVAALSSFALLQAERFLYRARLASLRRRGRLGRKIVIVGDNEEAVQLHDLIVEHPELGYELSGIIGDAASVAELGLPVPWLGPYESAALAVASVSEVGGAMLASSAMAPKQLNRVVRHLLRAGIHIHMTSGLTGFSHSRIISQEFAREPLLYVEQVALARWQKVLKRGIDIAIALVALLAVLPVLVVAALLIKAHDGGPVLFRQQRVGKHGVVFAVLKLRTMVVDAEARLQDLLDQSDRTGPLFKMSGDPRVTSVGRFLRAASIDELPQLFNVLRNEMSLVGPRPALPVEVAQFEEVLLIRSTVMPGITGLWQVEGRDDPSFSAYERLDLFYVENWSVGLDLAILASTAKVVLTRGYRALRPLDLRGGEASMVLD
jgi:exopolysaccharide biosynthesis polyprenyl glycosylphosphotransferase